MLGSDQITVLATFAQTNGALFAVEVRMPPGGGPPVMHRHAPGEIYYVTEGEFTFYTVDRAQFGRSALPLASARRCRSPAARRTRFAMSRTPTRSPLSCMPPARRWNTSSAPRPSSAKTGNPSMEAVLALADQNGIEMLGPIPARR